MQNIENNVNGDEIDRYLTSVSADSIRSFITDNLTKLGNMQQSAGIILTVLSLVMTICFGNLSSNDSGNYNSKEKLVISFVVFVSLIFLIFSFIYLFNILLPKIIKAELNSFSDINNALLRSLSKEKMLQDDYVILVNRHYTKIFDDMNMELRKLLNKNQENYSKCISCAIISFVGNLFFIFFLLIKFIFSNFDCISLYIYFVIFSTVMLFTVIKLLIFNEIKEL
jgi:hypothetical protein